MSDNVSALAVPTMLDIKTTAARVNLPVHFIRTLVWQNRVVYVRAGTRYLINLEKLVEYLNGTEVTPPCQIKS